MPRPRKPKDVSPWDLIHRELAEIQQSMKVYKTSRSHYRMSYFGTGKMLKQNCLRILNLLAALDKELEFGLNNEDRWT